MDKKALQKIRIRPKRAFVRMAKEDKCIDREMQYSYNSSTFHAKSFATRRYIQADKADGLIVVSVWRRSDLAAGLTEPVIMHFVDVEHKEYISRVDTNLNRTGWSTAKFSWLMDCVQRENGEHWNYAKDVESGLKLVNRKLGTEQIYIENSLRRWEDEIRERKLKEKKLRTLEGYREDMDLFGELPEEFANWIDGEGFRDINFIFYRREGKRQQALCTYCGELFTPREKLKHTPGAPETIDWNGIGKNYCRCPNCGGLHVTKAWGRQKQIRVHKYAAMFWRDNERIAGRQVHVIIEFTKDAADMWYRKTWTNDGLREFLDPKTIMAKKTYIEEWDSMIGRSVWRPKFTFTTSMRRTPLYSMQYTRVYTANLRDTFIEYAHLADTMERHFQYSDVSPEAAIRTIIRKSYVEYLDKAGLRSLSKQTLEGGWQSEHPTANNLKDLMEIDGNQLRRMKDLDGDAYILAAIKYVKEHNEKIDDATLLYMKEMRLSVNATHCERTGLTLQRQVNYLKKQTEIARSRGEVTSVNSIASRYGDYLNIAEDLGINIRDEIVCHSPKMLQLHDRYVEEKKRREGAKRDIMLDQKYANIEKNREKTEKHFAYENKELVILVPGRASDITEEGRRQHHCVGTNEDYIRRMNSGEAFILFLRKKKDTSEPYYTLEVEYNGKIKQAYGKFDRKPDWDKVESVLSKFTKRIGDRTKKETVVAG